MAMHLEACEDILSDRSVNPTNLDIYIFELDKEFLDVRLQILFYF